MAKHKMGHDCVPVKREPIKRDPERERQVDDYWYNYIRETCDDPHPDEETRPS